MNHGVYQLCDESIFLQHKSEERESRKARIQKHQDKPREQQQEQGSHSECADRSEEHTDHE